MKRLFIVSLVCLVLFNLLGCSRVENPIIPTQELPKMNEGISFSRTVILENADIRVTIMEISFIPHGYLEIRTLYENYTSEELVFYTSAVAVDDYSVKSNSLGCSVAANDKSEDNEWVEETETLLAWGLRDVATIQIECRVENSSREEIYTKEIKLNVNNYSPKTNRFLEGLENGDYCKLTNTTMDYLHKETLFCNEGIEIRTAALVKDSLGRSKLCLEVMNNTGKAVDCEVLNVTINGLLINNYPSSSPVSYFTVQGYKRYIAELWIDPPDNVQKYMNLGEIAEISFSIKVDYDEYPVTIDIPDRTGSFDSSGQIMYNSENITIIYKGIYKTGYTIIEYDPLYTEKEITYYEMLMYVDNREEEELKVELDKDSLFLNYKKAAFCEYKTMSGKKNEYNFGRIPAGYQGYIVVKIDESIENKGVYESNITDIEMKLLVELGWNKEYSKIVRLFV